MSELPLSTSGADYKVKIIQRSLDWHNDKFSFPFKCVRIERLLTSSLEKSRTLISILNNVRELLCIIIFIRVHCTYIKILWHRNVAIS